MLSHPFRFCHSNYISVSHHMNHVLSSFSRRTPPLRYEVQNMLYNCCLCNLHQCPMSSSLLALNVLKHSQSITVMLFCDMKPCILYRLCNELSRVCAGEFSVLQVNFNLQRHTGYFLIQVYVPCILIVVLSWVSFWIHREATSDRVGLGNCTD